MAKYSAFKYSAEKYGQGEQDANLLWGFTVAWDGFYGHGNEANWMTSLHVKRGRQAMVGKDGIVPYAIGKATGIFDNGDGRYDPYNASSPLYGNITPGKFVRIVVRDEANTTTYGVMRGTIADIQPIRVAGKEQVRIVVVDGFQWLRDNIINLGLNQAFAKHLVAQKITDAVDWPDAEWDMEIQTVVPTHAYWWAWNQNALEALNEFNAAEWAVAFHSRDGEFVWYPNDYGRRRTLDLNETDLLAEIGRPQPWDVVRNIIRVTVETKVLDPINAIIWSLQDVPSIADGAEFYIEPLFKYEEWRPCGAAIAFNHTVNAQADGGGADLTANCPLTYNDQIGEGAQITITNNSGSTGYVILLTATGNAIYAPDVNVVEVSDSTSQADYGKRVLQIKSRWVEDTDYAIALADQLLASLKEPAQYPIIQMEDQPTKQFYPDLYDQINLTCPTLDIRESFRVGQIEHQTVGESCQGIRTIMHLEGGEDMAYKGCYIGKITTAQTIASATDVLVTFNQEDHDVTGFHSLTTNPERITVPAGMAGYYRIFCKVKWEADGGATGARVLSILLNGGAGALFARLDDATPEIMHQGLVGTYYLDVGDYLTVEVYQNSGGNLDVEVGANHTYFGVDFLGA